MKQRRLDTDTDWDLQPTKQAKIADKDGAKPMKPSQRSSLGLQTLSDFESFQKANADKVNGAVQNRRRRFFKPEAEQTGSDSEGSNPIRRFDEELPNRGVEGLSDSNSQGDELQARYSTKKPVESKPELLYLDWKAVGQKQLDPLPPVHVRASEVVLRPKVDGVLPEKIKQPTLVFEGIAATTKSGYTHIIDQLDVSSTRRELLNSLMEQFVTFRCQQVTQATNKFLEETQFRESLKDHHLNVYNRNRELALQQVEGMVASMEESLDKTYTTIKTQFVPEICSHLDVTVPKLKNYEPDATFEEVTRGICASHKQNLQDQLRNTQEYGAAKEQRVKEMIRSIRDAHAKLDTKEKKLADSLSRGLNWTGGNTDPLKDLHKIATASFSSTIPDSERDATQVLDSY